MASNAGSIQRTRLVCISQIGGAPIFDVTGLGALPRISVYSFAQPRAGTWELMSLKWRKRRLSI